MATIPPECPAEPILVTQGDQLHRIDTHLADHDNQLHQHGMLLRALQVGHTHLVDQMASVTVQLHQQDTTIRATAAGVEAVREQLAANTTLTAESREMLADLVAARSSARLVGRVGKWVAGLLAAVATIWAATTDIWKHWH